MHLLSRRARLLLVTFIALMIVVGIAALFFRPRFPELPPTFADIYYADETDLRRSLDIYLPSEESLPAPVAIMLHGNRGDKTNFRYTAGQLTSQGFAVVLPSYRIEPITYSDAFCALAWIHANAAEYRLDTNHVYAIGWSSGGGIAVEMLATNHPGELLEDCPHEAPVVWLDGAILLAAGSDRWPESGWRTNEAPVMWIDGNEPPVILIHGEQDAVIPAEDSTQLASLLEESGVEVQLLMLPGADHLFALPGNTGYDEMIETVTMYLLAMTA